MVIWGAISCLTGITTNFVGALLTRFFLGFVEAAFLPGTFFLKRFERNRSLTDSRFPLRRIVSLVEMVHKARNRAPLRPLILWKLALQRFRIVDRRRDSRKHGRCTRPCGMAMALLH